MNKQVKIKENKNFDIHTQESALKIVKLSFKIEDAIKNIIGEEDYKLNTEDARMIAIVALSVNYKKRK